MRSRSHYIPCLRAHVNQSYSLFSTRTKSNLIGAFDTKLLNRSLMPDQNQTKVIKLLDHLSNNIAIYLKNKADISSSQIKSSFDEKSVKPFTINTPRGLFLWGEVGTGKTMVMDLFYENLSIKCKKRVHFHKYMLYIHNKIHHYKKDLLLKYGRDIHLNLSSERDAILQVALEESTETQLLCFDEFQVTDIADAIIMSKFFNELWRNGVILIATSNRPPSDLYKDGLNRSYFLPFIEALQHYCIVYNMNSTIDYRTLEYNPIESTSTSTSTKNSNSNSFLVPNNEYNKNKLYELFLSLTSSSSSTTPKPVKIPIMMGRFFEIPLAVDGYCWIDFCTLCESDRGAADYHAICKHFHTVFITDIPSLSVLEHDRARRFITLIDELYDAKVKLYCTAANDPLHLFVHTTPIENNDNDNNSDNMQSVETVRSVSVSGTTPAIPPLNETSTATTTGTTPVNIKLSMRNSEQISFTKTLKIESGGSTCTSTSTSNTSSSIDEELSISLKEGELASVQELGFAFRRAASRLVEMSQSKYRNM